MADNWINLLCDPKDYELNVIWECLNSVYFTDEQGMLAHRRLLMKYRRQVAKQIHGGDIAPKRFGVWNVRTLQRSSKEETREGAARES